MTKNNFTVVSANVQGLKDDKNRCNLFSKWSKQTKADLFLLSEVGKPSTAIARQWTKDCQDAGLDGLFFADCQAAIVWRPSSPHLSKPSPTSIQSISSSLASSNRSVDAIFEICGKEYVVMSVYVPVQAPERKPFLTDLGNRLSRRLVGLDFFIGGDWNCVPEPFMDSTNPEGDNIGHDELHRLIHMAQMVDTYRLLNPRKLCFTNVHPAANRRLDQIYISQGMTGHVSKVYQWEKGRSTHLPVVLAWTVPGALPIGPSWFKAPNDLFTDDKVIPGVVSLVRSCWERTATDAAADPCERWRRTKAQLLPRLNELSYRLAMLRRSKSKEALALRARLPVEDTGPASIHIRLKQVRAQDLVESLQAKDGKLLEEPDDMLGECISFFGGLYKSQPSSKKDRDQLLSHLRKKVLITDHRKLEEPFSEGSLQCELLKARPASAPGPDGLPFQFYTATWEVTGPILAECLNALMDGTGSPPVHETNIVLLHKSGDKDRLGNKRPIALINTDERLMDKAVNSRVAAVLPKLIHRDQTGFIPGRWIGENIETVQNAIEDGHKYKGVLASIDLEKAYDKVEHAYLETVLIKFGFGLRIRRLMMGSSINTKARVVLNGWLSAPFAVERGVRQGSPLAPSLFALCMEPLAAKLRQELIGVRHTGLEFGQEDIQPFRTTLFADDLSAALHGDGVRDLAKLNAGLDLFKKAGGGTVNRKKSFVYGLGQTLQGTSWHGWPVQKGPFRYLGIQVGKDVDTEEVWSAIASKVERRMQGIPMFDLSIASKCSIINIYCYTKIFYVDQFLPAPEKIVKRLEDAARAAIWGKKKALVSEEHLLTPTKHGGFGLLPLRTRLASGRAKWIYQLLGAGWRTHRYLGARRRSICQHIEAEKEADKRSPAPCMTKFGAWKGAELGRRVTTWRWPAIFFAPPMSNRFGWSSAFSSSYHGLPYRWRQYLDAWEDLVACEVRTVQRFEADILKAGHADFSCEVDLGVFSMRGLDRKKAPVAQVGKLTKAVVQKRATMYRVPGYNEKELGWKESREFWKKMKSVRFSEPDEAESLHLLVLGRLQRPHKWGNWNGNAPNNASTYCCLCLEPLAETIQHLFVECHVSLTLRGELGVAGDGVSVAGSIMGDEPDYERLCLLAKYVHIIYKLTLRRRFGKSPLASAISEEQIEQIVQYGLHNFHL